MEKSMKIRKKLTAVVLMLVMVFSLSPVAQVSAASNENAEGSPTENVITPSIRVYAPYKSYYNVDNVPYALCKFSLDADKMLKDDFGIGLKSDGTPDVEEDGKGYVSVLRVLACYIREVISKRNKDTWFTAEEQDGSDEYLKKLKEKANSVMKNYIRIAKSDRGGYDLEGLSDDGVHWDEGLASKGKSPYRSHWMHYEDFVEGEKIISETPVKSDEYIEILLLPFGTDTGILVPSTFDPMDLNPEVNEEVKYLIKKQTFDKDEQPVQTPISGAKFRVYKPDGTMDDTILTTDADGYLTYIPKEEGYHYLVGCEEYDDGQGNVYSKTDVALITVPTFGKTPKAQSVKLTVTGKKKAKKKNIKVSFKMNNTYYANKFTTYDVYLSKKKTSGYKKVASTNGTKLSVTIKNKKKGTYFVKIQATLHFPFTFSGEPYIKQFKSGFTSPKKVVIK